MKYITNLLAICLLITVSQMTHAQNKVEWKEKDDFHKVISQTFHPMEDGNFEPIRSRNTELLEKAIAWQKSQVPTGVDVKKVSASLQKLVIEVQDLNNKITNEHANDETIKADLSKIHDTFHEIAGICNPDEHHDHDKHDGDKKK